MAKQPSNHKSSTGLPVVSPDSISCTNCGVCCFHMGYPAFITPREPLNESDIEQQEAAAGRSFSARKRAELIAGHPGESHWHRLPEDLKSELIAYIEDYTVPNYGATLDTFDGPCIWLDMETRMCKHHTYRPNVCRDFETGNPQCLDWRETYADRIPT